MNVNVKCGLLSTHVYGLKWWLRTGTLSVGVVFLSAKWSQLTRSSSTTTTAHSAHCQAPQP